MIRSLEQCKLNLLRNKFDELNVFQECSQLYADWIERSKLAFRVLYSQRYAEVWGIYRPKEEPEDLVDELVELYFIGLLEEPNELTHYIYELEAKRKEERCVEAVNAVSGSVGKQAELDKALRFFAQQTQWYVDQVSDGATWQALKDMGYKYVKWVTMEDNKVCSQCDSLDGKIFRIDSVPSKQHLNCRCIVVPVSRQ